jgi:hypothetical protein
MKAITSPKHVDTQLLGEGAVGLLTGRATGESGFDSHQGMEIFHSASYIVSHLKFTVEIFPG